MAYFPDLFLLQSRNGVFICQSWNLSSIFCETQNCKMNKIHHFRLGQVILLSHFAILNFANFVPYPNHYIHLFKVTARAFLGNLTHNNDDRDKMLITFKNISIGFCGCHESPSFSISYPYNIGSDLSHLFTSKFLHFISLECFSRYLWVSNLR